jgi:hypothetical protein
LTTFSHLSYNQITRKVTYQNGQITLRVLQCGSRSRFSPRTKATNCSYDFSAPVIKEKRLDGILVPTQAGELRYFLKVQGYLNQQIYWQVVRQIAWFHKENPAHDHKNWMALILFLDESYDPGVETLGLMAKNAGDWLKTGVLKEQLKALDTQQLEKLMAATFSVDPLSEFLEHPVIG